MQTVVLSDAAYQRILSLRIGSESLSTVILRETKLPESEVSMAGSADIDDSWDVERIEEDMDRILKSSKVLCNIDVVLR